MNKEVKNETIKAEKEPDMEKKIAIENVNLANRFRRVNECGQIKTFEALVDS